MREATNTPRQPARRLFEVFVLSLVGLAVLLYGCGGGGAGGGAGATEEGVAVGAGGLATLTGRVVSASGGTAVNNATVMAGSVTTRTVSDGSYVLPNVPAGTQIVVGSGTGFFSQSSLVFVQSNALQTVNITLRPTSGSGGNGGSAPTGTGPKIKSTNPSKNSSQVDPRTQIIITFDQAVDPLTISTSSVLFSRVTSSSSVDDSGCSTLTLFSGIANSFLYVPGDLNTSTKACPANPNLTILLGNSDYQITVTNRVKGSNGLPSPGDFTKFKTRPSGSGGGSTVTGPKLVFRNPEDKATNVDPATRVLFAFDADVLPATVTTTRNVIFSRISPPSTTDSAGRIIVATQPFVNRSFEFLPSPSFMTDSTTYALFITNRVLSASGIPAQGESFSFGTRRFLKTLDGPGVIATSPSSGSINISTDTRILITFDRPIDAASLTPGVITLTETTPTVSAFVVTQTLLTAPENTVEVFYTTPNRLSQLAGYQVVLSNRIRDPQGNPARPFSFSFKTRQVSAGGGGSTSLIVPKLKSSNPVDKTTNVDINSRILLTFDVDMDLPSLRKSNSVVVTQITSPAEDLTTVDVTMTNVLPAARTFEVIRREDSLGAAGPTPFRLKSLTDYRVFLSNSIRAEGVSGGFLNPTVFSFKTRFAQGGCGDTSPPNLASSNPPDNALNVDKNVSIIFSFSELVLTTTVNPSSVVLTQLSTPSSRDTPVASPTPLPFAQNKPVPCVTPTVNVSAAAEFRYNLGTLVLSPGATFQLFLTNEVKDLAGNRLAPTSIKFTIAKIETISQGPRIASSNPVRNTTNVDPSSLILLTFDKDILQPTDLDAFDDPSGGVTWTVRPANVFLSRITSPAENDKPTEDVTTRFVVSSGTQAIGGQPTTYQLPLDPTTGKRMAPFVFRPDPLNFPRTFQYISGKLKLQGGLVRYTIFITNGVKDKSGLNSPGDEINFTTRPSVSSPGAGPRLLSTNPPTGSCNGPTVRVLLTFDKPVLPASMTTLAVNMEQLAKPTGGTCDQMVVCDPRTEDLIGCLCVFGTSGLTFTDVSSSVGAAAQTIWQIGHPPFTLGITGTVFLSINGFLLSDGSLTGEGINLPAPGDTTFFFIR